ncbi:alpha/beta hydrolase [Lutibaculum baratangense]|uniref:Alpha/beta hydrolase fold-3 domain-containing protein n=1 Tax=Lutibaculum baratangense AMV1 TaxID=631454 RepID=V4RNJ3_9HYPH|nr:alpha/beta hydrolase [Lutibaculum baratangense]ESR26844.1 hypothetical protein N177_0628 [Lutibaculum baratangense AMV1]
MSEAIGHEDSVYQYMTGQIRPHHPALIDDFVGESARVRDELPGPRDVRYGPHPRQVFDLFPAGEGAPLLAFFHAGYWQSRDKDQFQFVARPLVAAGLSVATVNYPLCPDVTLPELTEAVRAAVPALLEAVGSPGLVAAGHSAGAHLAVELAATDWQARGFDRNPVHGVLALSGVYDLVPLLATPLNDRLRLDEAGATAASPLDRLPPGLPPAVFAVGGAETKAFLSQSVRMHEAWIEAGAESRYMIVPGADHMSLLKQFGPPDSLLTSAAVTLAGPRD